jgi:hypothetical protein
LHALLKGRIVDIYQPLPWLGIDKAQRYDSTLQRWHAIAGELDGSTGCALDIGCNLGFFTFQMARRGFFCLGIEGDALLYHICNLIKEVGEFDNTVFTRAMVDEQFSKTLPTVDVTLFLSVFHHIVRTSGMDKASRLMVELMRKTRQIMFFETGQSNEHNVSWAKYLPPMTPNPREWTENYFVSLGASRVKHLGEYATHLSPVKRSLFAVYMA